MNPSWEIYERWCFLQVVRVMADVVSQPEEKIFYKDGGDNSILATITNSNHIFEIRLQDTFPSYSESKERMKYSLSNLILVAYR